MGTFRKGTWSLCRRQQKSEPHQVSSSCPTGQTTQKPGPGACGLVPVAPLPGPQRKVGKGQQIVLSPWNFSTWSKGCKLRGLMGPSR